MKIVKESLNEISRTVGGSPLQAIKVGKESIIDKIKTWCYDNDIHNYHITDDLEIALHYQLDYIRIQHNVKLYPPYIKFRFTPSATAFIIAVELKYDEMLADILQDYKNLNLEIPTPYRKFVEDMKNLHYECVSTKKQLDKNVYVFIDLTLNKVFGLYFFDGKEERVIIRNYSVSTWGGGKIMPYILKKLSNVNVIDYSPIVDYLAEYRRKQQKKRLNK